MKAGLTRDDYLAWFRRVEEGPFSSVSCGERVHGPSCDMRVVLAAAATATERVEITPTLYVLPMHSPVQVAREVATLDLIAAGRVRKVCLGYGGREQDYQALGARYQGRYGRMDRHVSTLRRVWAGEEVVPGGGAIGPRPVRDGGPMLLAGAIGPKSIERCSQWADGLYAWSGNGEQAELERAFAIADAAWANSGRPRPPYRMGGFWYSLVDDAQQRLYDYVYEYLAIAGPEIATFMAQSVSRNTPESVSEALANAAAAGCEELFLVPATADLAEVDRVSELIVDLGYDPWTQERAAPPDTF
jgi:alkanesulfonate monooxygenase SsuD/methylene tetrahydromethanopterin reductase-like flavin-dependent oxidoreductase (luciferase family)